MNILCVANSKFIQHIFVFLYSLYANNLCEINLYLIHTDISASDLEKIDAFSNKWDKKHFIPIKYDLDFASDLRFTESFPKEIYYRLLCADILPSNLDKILSLDLDIVITKSIEDLYNTDISGYPLAACKDILGYIFCEADRNLSRLNLNSSGTYFNVGTMLINLNYFRENNCSETLLKTANQLSSKLVYYEQDVLNYHFIDNYFELPWHSYNLVPVRYIMKTKDVQTGIFSPLSQKDMGLISSFDDYSDYTIALRDNASIIHYIAGTKPWLPTRPSLQVFDVYYNYYKEQLENLIGHPIF